MSTADAKQIDRVELLSPKAAGGSLRAKLVKDLVTSNGKIAIQRGDTMVRSILLAGLLADLMLEAYLVWRFWKTSASS